MVIEEYETGREEMKAANEELQTGNQDNRHKVEELAQLTGDLQNLLAATDIATLFLDRRLRILRFTPKVSELFNVRTTDHSRPISDFTHCLGYQELAADCQAVLDKLAPIRREVQDQAGRWYLTRVLPYRSSENRIEGVVLTFVDISERKQAEEALRHSEEFHRLAVEAANVGTWDLDVETGDCAISGRMAELMGYGDQPQVVPQAQWTASVHPDDLPALRAAVAASVEHGTLFELEFRVLPAAGETRWLYAKGGVPAGGTGQRLRLHGAAIDVTARKQALEELRRSEERLRQAAAAGRFGSYCYDIAEEVVYWTAELFRIHGLPEQETIDFERIATLIHPDDRPRYREFIAAALAKPEGEEYAGEFRIVRPDGQVRWMADHGSVIFAGEGPQRRATQAAGMVIDITERKEAELAVRRLNESLEAQVEERTTLLKLLQDVTRTANEARTVAEAMQGALSRIVEYNDWQIGHVWWLADDGSRQMVSSRIWHAVEGAEASLQRLAEFKRVSQQMRFHAEQGFIGEVIATGLPRWIDDIRQCDDWHRGDPDEWGLRAAMAFPITVDDTVVAVLECFSGHPLEPEERFLEVMTDLGIQLGHVLKRQQLQRDVADATNMEQRRIAHDIHDGVGQELTGLKYLAQTHAESLSKLESPEAAVAARITQGLSAVQRQMREVIRDLVPVELDEKGLAAALQSLADRTNQAHGIDCEFVSSSPVAVEDNLIATQLFRIVQEAVSNAVRHSGADTISIRLERDGQLLTAEVVDDGGGFHPQNQFDIGFGLRSMAYRANLIGAQLSIDSQNHRGSESSKQGGTVVHVAVPLRPFE